MIRNDPIAIASIIKVVGGLILLTQARNKKAKAEVWAKNVLALSGFTSLFGGLFFLFLEYAEKILTLSTIEYINHYKTLIDGITIGLLIALFCSGELSFKKWQT